MEKGERIVGKYHSAGYSFITRRWVIHFNKKLSARKTVTFTRRADAEKMLARLDAEYPAALARYESESSTTIRGSYHHAVYFAWEDEWWVFGPSEKKLTKAVDREAARYTVAHLDETHVKSKGGVPRLRTSPVQQA